MLSHLGLGLFIFLFNVQIGVGQFNYIPDVIKISVKESSPPALALSEVNATYIDNTISASTPITELKVGIALLPQLELEEILINELEQADSKVSDKNDIIMSSNEMKIYSDDDVYPDNLSQEQLSRLKVAQQKYQILDKDWTGPQQVEESMGDKVQRLNKDLRSQEAQNKVKSDVIVKGDDSISNLNHENSKQTKNLELAENIDIKHSDRKDQVGITLNGLIEFERKTDIDRMLVLTPEHRIEVRRFAEGIPQEFGIVRLPEATFNIQIQSNYGVIIAQLINANGIIEGQGMIAVQDLIKNKNFRPTLVIKSIPKGNIQVASAYGASFQKDFQKNLGFDIFGTFDRSKSLPKESYADNIYADSEAVIQATGKDHASTTSIISLADGAELMLLPDKMINGLIEILSEQGASLNLQAGDSLIWGQVRKDGKPVAGATVFAERTDAIYFGGMHLPDQLRTMTSDNGMFVVIVNDPGWKDLFVQMEDGSKIHLNVLTFPGKVAQAFADIPTREISVSMRSFDAFSGEPTRAKVQIQQIEDVVDTGDVGLSVVNIPFTQSLSFVNVYPEAPFMDAKFTYTKMQDFLHFPMIRRDWVEQIAKFIRINPDPTKGIIVGFVQNGNYSLTPSSPEQNKENLVYFNSKGEVINSGNAGGGFILYNQSVGFSGIIIEDSKHQKKFHKIASPENKVVSILSFVL
jgi:hypothetical protein